MLGLRKINNFGNVKYRLEVGYTERSSQILFNIVRLRCDGIQSGEENT